jgi:hypothetical protein
MRRNVAKIVVALSAVFIASVLLDRLLGVLGYPSTPPVVHPGNFKQVRRNVEFDYSFETNSHGLRSKDLSTKKAPGTSRIFVAGDSYVEGFGVDADDTMVSRLETYANRDGDHVAFINGGLAGTGPLEYYKVFSHVGVQYDLDGLLISIYANDVSDTRALGAGDAMSDEALLSPPLGRIKHAAYLLYPRMFEMFRKISRDYHTRYERSDLIGSVSQRARKLGITPAEVEAWVAKLPMDLVEASNKEMFGGQILAWGLLEPYYWTDALDIDTPRAKNKWRFMVRVLDAMVARARREGIEVAVLYLPMPFQYDGLRFDPTNPWVAVGTTFKQSWLYETSTIQVRLEEWSRNQNLPFLDLTPTFRQASKNANGQKLNWTLDGHWTPEGHRIAAVGIYEWLRSAHVFSFLH